MSIDNAAESESDFTDEVAWFVSEVYYRSKPRAAKTTTPNMGTPDERRKEIIARIASLQKARNDIKAEIGEAKARVWKQGKYSDPEWFAEVNAALLDKQSAIVRLMSELTAIKQARRSGNQESVYQHFKRIVRERLGDEEYRQLIEQAVRAAEDEQGGIAEGTENAEITLADRRAFLALPMEERRRIMARQADEVAEVYKQEKRHD